MESIYVKFIADSQFENGVRISIYKKGLIIDKYRDIVTVNDQPLPSGKGGTIKMQDFKMSADFYLILAEDNSTHKVRCKDVIILPGNIQKINFKHG